MNDTIKGEKAQNLIGYYLVILVTATVLATIINIPFYINITILVTSLALLFLDLNKDFSEKIKTIIYIPTLFMMGINIVFIFNFIISLGFSEVLNTLLITIPLTLITSIIYVVEKEAKYFRISTCIALFISNSLVIVGVGLLNKESIISIVIVCFIALIINFVIIKDFNNILKNKDKNKSINEKSFLINISLIYLPIRICLNLVLITVKLFEKKKTNIAS